jgi:2-methylcitrate dehydratase
VTEVALATRGAARKTRVAELADFVAGVRFEDMAPATVEQLKIRMLDGLGCAIGALGSPFMERMLRFAGERTADGAPLIGGGCAAIERAAFYNAALVRYLDFNDSFIAPNETCHPSDNIGAVYAAACCASASGRDFLLALAVAYAVQCRLSEVLPVRARGLDHTVQLTYGTTAGVAKLLGLDRIATANALSIAGTTGIALRVTRTGPLTNWKGLAAPYATMLAVQAALLAREGVTGPPEVLEGNKGLFDLAGRTPELVWDATALEMVKRTFLKRYNAEVHSQSAIEAVVELRNREQIVAKNVEHIRLETFDVAFNIIGGGEEGEKYTVSTKEQADHSLPYLLAVALIDGDVMPEQYRAERIDAADVQSLLRKVEVVCSPELSRRFPQQIPAVIAIRTSEGESYSAERRDYRGYVTNPMSWSDAVEKFMRLTHPHGNTASAEALISIVQNLENEPVSALTDVLQRIGGSS